MSSIPLPSEETSTGEPQKQNLRYLVMPDFVYEDSRLTDISRRVYCFIHTFKGDRFYFSNEHMAEMFHCSEWGISKAVKQLMELEYIHADYDIKASGGKIRYIKDLRFEMINSWVRHEVDPISEVGSTQSPTLARPHKNDNKIKENKINKNTLPTVMQKAGYGNGDINLLMETLKSTFHLPLLDGTEKDNRFYANLCMKKFGGVEKVTLLIRAARENRYWGNKIASFKKLYYNGVGIISEAREGGDVYDATHIA